MQESVSWAGPTGERKAGAVGSSVPRRYHTDPRRPPVTASGLFASTWIEILPPANWHNKAVWIYLADELFINYSPLLFFMADISDNVSALLENHSDTRCNYLLQAAFAIYMSVFWIVSCQWDSAPYKYTVISNIIMIKYERQGNRIGRAVQHMTRRHTSGIHFEMKVVMLA